MSLDLFVLVADVQQEKTLETLLTHRQHSLGIRPITFQIARHPRNDSGVYHEADAFLNSFQPPLYSHGLVVLDADWAGCPGDAAGVRENVINRLCKKGWQEDNCEAIVIAPELEVWLWADSAEVPQALRTTWTAIHALADKHNYWTNGQVKPEKPKELLEAVLQEQGRPRSSSIYQEIAGKVSLKRCQDPAFILLRETLVRWFPADPR